MIFTLFAVEPTFRINDFIVHSPESFASRITYVYDKSRGSPSPLKIFCLYGNESLLNINDSSYVTQYSAENQDGFKIELLEGTGLVTISPRPWSSLNLKCKRRPHSSEIELFITTGLF